MDYNQQAEDFLKKSGITINKNLLYTKKEENKGKIIERDFYSIELIKGDKKAVIEFTDSIYNTILHKAKEKIGGVNMFLFDYARDYIRSNNIDMSLFLTIDNFIKRVKEYKSLSDYSILACLDSWEMSFDEFCWRLGFDEDSRKALDTYLKCQAETAELNKVFTNEDWEELKEIQ